MATDFVQIETHSRLYYFAAVLDAREGIEVTIWRRMSGGLASLTRREIVPDVPFEAVVARLETAARWL